MNLLDADTLTLINDLTLGIACGVLLCCFLAHLGKGRLGDSFTKAMSIHVGRYALVYLLGFGFALAASLSAFIDIFIQLTRKDVSELAWWQILALIGKAVYPGLVALLAFLNQSFSRAATAAGSPASSVTAPGETAPPMKVSSAPPMLQS